ncbi:MAG: hypothetical protein OXC61_04215 [Flavobacteriaceae bacterium]|nr:hypothetical protein [Flavobacteriaceae bacterium]
MNSSLVGVIPLISSVFICYSCSNTSWAYTITYAYKNLSGIHLTMEAYQIKEVHQPSILGQKWDLPNAKTIQFEPLRTQAAGPEPFDFDDDYDKGVRYDSVVIRFDNKKCLNYTRSVDNNRNLLRRESYLGYEMRLNKSKKHDAPYYNSHDFTLTWIFTPEDVAQAVDCDRL